MKRAGRNWSRWTGEVEEDHVEVGRNDRDRAEVLRQDEIARRIERAVAERVDHGEQGDRHAR